MIDIHNHVIFGVDDGSPTIKESIRMVLEAEKLGIRAIIATPHFNSGIYDSGRAEENLQELRHRVKDCDVELYLGYEVFITQSIDEVVSKNRSLRLNSSDYLLLELPMDIVPAYAYDIVYKLHLNNIIPIIAHPERNRFFVNNFTAFMGFIEKGCLLQLDAASIIGVYGSKVKNFTQKLITLNLAHFVASDAHSSADYSEWVLKARQRVIQWSGKEYADKLFYSNAKSII